MSKKAIYLLFEKYVSKLHPENVENSQGVTFTINCKIINILMKKTFFVAP